MKRFILIGLILFPVTIQSFAQYVNGWYRVNLTDKDHSAFSVDRPQEFLSERALQRRTAQQIPVVENDLPVSRLYLDSLSRLGIPVKNVSRWFNSVVTGQIDTNQVKILLQQDFVSDILPVKPASGLKSTLSPRGYKNLDTELQFDYGMGLDQIAIHNGEKLHQLGYTGKGMHMAIIDAGFRNANSVTAFQRLWNNYQILGFRDFAAPGSDIFNEHSHGTTVLSVIASYIPGVMTGTSPDASFWLLRSEDVNSEYLIEEDNWVSAAEFADSVGVDVINTSLGYTVFDEPSQNHTYADMDGNTTRISRGANIAASKGMLLVNSAGNDGATNWKYIGAPADADSVLAVGATDFTGSIAYFSSRGPGAKGNLKPDICAIGSGAYVISYMGLLAQSRGTSLSSPVIAGLAACLWQANKQATNMEIFKAILESSDRYATPDTAYGYGIPDFYKANLILKTKYRAEKDTSFIFNLFPNPFRHELYLSLESESETEIILTATNSMVGIVKKLMIKINTGYNLILLDKLSDLPPGIYYLNLQNGQTSTTKIMLKTQ